VSVIPAPTRNSRLGFTILRITFVAVIDSKKCLLSRMLWQLKRLGAGFSPRPHRWLEVRFVVDEVTLEQVFLRLFRLSLLPPPPLYTHLRCAIALTRQHIIIPSVLS
jgi:hypothetical protein